MLRDIRSVTVARSSPSHCVRRPRGPPGELLRVHRHSDSVARALERPASGFSACRECCVSACLVAGCGGGLSGGFWLRIYGFTDLRIHPPPSPSRGPAVRRASTNQVGAGRYLLTAVCTKIGQHPPAAALCCWGVVGGSRPQSGRALLLGRGGWWSAMALDVQGGCRAVCSRRAAPRSVKSRNT